MESRTGIKTLVYLVYTTLIRADLAQYETIRAKFYDFEQKWYNKFHFVKQKEFMFSRRLKVFPNRSYL